MKRVPLLSGSRVVLVPVGEEDVVVRAPPASEQVVDVAGAVRDALRFPISGQPLRELAPRGGRATIVVEPAALPVPGGPQDARQTAIAVAIEELERCGIPDERQTILVAGGLGRRFGQNDLERLLSPPRARAFHGRVVVHDVEDERLVPLVGDVRVSPALVETDLVLAVTAAESVLHGGPAVFVAAADVATNRRVVEVDSLLEAPGSQAWTLALEIEDALAARVAVAGVSLALDLPRLTGRYRGYPESDTAVERVVRSPLRTILSFAPDQVRSDLLSGHEAPARGARRVRRDAVGGPRRGAPAGSRAPGCAPARAGGRARRRDPLARAPRPARVAEPDHDGRGRARSRAPRSGAAPSRSGPTGRSSSRIT